MFKGYFYFLIFSYSYKEADADMMKDDCRNSLDIMTDIVIR